MARGKRANPTVGTVADLAQLPRISEDDIVTALKDRYAKDTMYTRVGANTLVALNPVQQLETSSDAVCKKYAIWADDTNQDKGTMPPHVFELAGQAFYHMLRNEQDQSILLTGETGSGKSQVRKLITRELCALSRTKKKSKVLSGVVKMDSALDAFGNAKTTNNPDSSRFGRYTEYQYDEVGKMIGAKTLDYLLEKARVCSTPENERNFHIFFYLLAGATPEERAQWHLTDTTHFAYLTGKRTTQQDAIQMNELRGDLKSLGVGRRMQAQLYQVLAAILHLGNVQFMDDPNRPQEACTVKNLDVLSFVAELLGVPPASLELALTYKTKKVKKELCTVFLNAQGANAQRDSLAKTLYSLSFGWLLEHINDRLCKEDCHTFVGVVDMSGFQNYRSNRFEQLMVNYANERLHAFVHDRAFAALHTDLTKEAIVNANQLPTTFPDNEAVMGLLAKSDGLMRLIDSESSKASSKKADAKLTEKLAEEFGKDASFFATKKATFGVKHFAGPVEYDTKGFTDKNTDVLSPDFVSIFRGSSDLPPSSSGFVRSLFSDKNLKTERDPRDKSVITAAEQPKGPVRHPSLKRRKSQSGNETPVKINLPTIIAGFDAAMEELLETLVDTIPWVVVCIKPNEDLLNGKFDSKRVKAQVKQFGLATLAQARTLADYTTVYTHEEFLQRYKVIVDPMNLPYAPRPRQKCDAFVQACDWTRAEMAVGTSRVFLAEGAWQSLEDEIRAIEEQMNGGKMRNKSSRRGNAYYSEDEGSDWASDAEGSVYGGMAESEYRYAPSVDPRRKSLAGSFKDGKDLELGRIKGDGEAGKDVVGVAEYLIDEAPGSTRTRKVWLCCTWALTWWIPSFCLSWCGKMKRRDIQLAWREKVALCIIIFFICASLLFYIVGLGRIICPKLAITTSFELAGRRDPNDIWVSAAGRVYQLNELVKNHKSSYGIEPFQFASLNGEDVSDMFYRARLFERYCPGITRPTPATWDEISSRRTGSQFYAHRATDTNTNSQQLYLEFLNQYAQARLAWPMKYIADQANQQKRLMVIYDNVYDVSTYYNAANGFFGREVENVLNAAVGKDASKEWTRLRSTIGQQADATLNCMNNLFYIGVVDHRNDFRCQFSNYILLLSSVVLVAVIGFKFLAALQFSREKDPEDHDKFVICQVPCYTEGPESLTKTLESLAMLRYDDKRKLLFIICDGMIIGSGNDRPTPRIVLDILGVDPSVDPEPNTFRSLGEGDRQLNYGKVYSGLYEVQGRAVPYIVVVKVGKPGERQRPGNRGKRDSQMILMRFLSRVHFNAEMSPLELDLYHHMKNIIGVNPSFYEYILNVDADTEASPDSLNRMVSAMIHDSKIMGLCGETLLSNEKDSWITMIQVYEYFISHNLAKAFESLFGSVTCLPGCFCMYRVRSPVKNVPLLISPAVINDYAENVVDTLHKKNLLHLGEDRYLTTLMMKHFPTYKLTYVPEAQCRTYAPDSWSVLLSQRRRWINSTVHNLLELVSLRHLCGFCCFSMRFVVFLDLFSTVVQPAGVLYVAYLIYSIVTNQEVFPVISIILIGAIYGFQVIIFILKRQWAQIGWMLVYIVALPVFAFYIPVYAFWHFDDFSWGNTRVVVGENGKKMTYSADVQPFDPRTVPLKRWQDYEQEMMQTWEKSTVGYAKSAVGYPGSEYGQGYAPSMMYSNMGQPFMIPPPAASVVSYMPHQSMMAPSMMAPSMAAPSVAPSQAPSRIGSEPTDTELEQHIRSILATADLMTVTKKQVRDMLSAHYGVDLTPRKATINKLIETILAASA